MTDEIAVADLRSLADLLDRQRADAPPSYRPGLTLGVEYARNLADAIEDDDLEGIVDAHARLRTGPLWLQRLPAVLPLVSVAPDLSVTIRWERVPPELRRHVVSFANLIVDAVIGNYHPGGRGKKKTS